MTYPIHPDDIESPRFGGWADDFNTYEEACIYYGADTPSQLKVEEKYYFELDCIAYQDDAEAQGHAIYNKYVGYPQPFVLEDWPF